MILSLKKSQEYNFKNSCISFAKGPLQVLLNVTGFKTCLKILYYSSHKIVEAVLENWIVSSWPSLSFSEGLPFKPMHHEVRKLRYAGGSHEGVLAGSPSQVSDGSYYQRPGVCVSEPSEDTSLQPEPPSLLPGGGARAVLTKPCPNHRSGAKHLQLLFESHWVLG